MMESNKLQDHRKGIIKVNGWLVDISLYVLVCLSLGYNSPADSEEFTAAYRGTRAISPDDV